MRSEVLGSDTSRHASFTLFARNSNFVTRTLHTCLAGNACKAGRIDIAERVQALTQPECLSAPHICPRKRRSTATLTPTHPRGLHTGNGALANQIPLEVGKRPKDMEHQPSRTARGIDRFCDRTESHAPPLQIADDRHQVLQRTCQAIQFPDHHGIPRSKASEGKHSGLDAHAASERNLLNRRLHTPINAEPATGQSHCRRIGGRMNEFFLRTNKVEEIDHAGYTEERKRENEEVTLYQRTLVTTQTSTAT